MKSAGYLAAQPAGLQILVLSLFIMGGNILSSLSGMGIFFLIHGTGAQISNYPDMLRLLQFLTAAGTFFLPSMVAAWLFSDNVHKYLSLDKKISLKCVGIVFLNIVLISPSVTLLSWLNEQLVFPEWAAPLEAWMREHEEMAQSFTGTLINGGGISPYLSNLAVIALMAAVSEELLFRGVLQRIIGRWTNNPHAVIWIAAVIFSAFHLQFYGFVPRMVLGAYFGYLLLWSKSIWLPICAHFFNNAISVTLMSSEALNESDFVTGHLEESHLLPCLLIALTTGCLFFLLNRRLKSLGTTD